MLLFVVLCFCSWIFQKLNQTEDFMLQPGLLYYYFSTVADVSANEFNINGSGIFFDNNASFATWYKTLPFNRTLPLFGPRAYRFDDYNEPVSYHCCTWYSLLCVACNMLLIWKLLFVEDRVDRKTGGYELIGIFPHCCGMPST